MKHQADNALRIRFSGGRFDAGVVPTNVLDSLDHLAKLIAETAWQEYSEETGQKKRSKAFNEAVSFGLAAVEAGSTVVAIRPTWSSPVFSGLDRFAHYLERAIKRVHRAVVAAERDEDIATVLDTKLLARFEKIVPDLQQTENVGLPDSVGTEPRYAELTQATRKTIIAASKVKPVVGPGVVYAYVPKINKRTTTFEMAVVDGSIRKDVKYGKADFETLHQAWESYRSELGAGNPVRIVGEMESTKQRNIRAVKSVSAIEKIDPLDVRARLLYLSGLQDGWYDGKGSRYSRDYLDSLADRFDLWYPSHLQNPAIFPHAGGTIGCEWSMPGSECILTVDPDSDTGEWIDFSLSNENDEVERDLDLSKGVDWRWFSERVAARGAEGKR